MEMDEIGLYRLMEEEMYLHVIDIHDYVGKSPKHLRRIKARMWPRPWMA